MTFNPIKCEFPTNNKQDKHHTIHLEVTHAKYLGVVIDQHLNWDNTQNKLLVKPLKY